MIVGTIMRAIEDRIKADTGSGGLYQSGAWSSSILQGGAWGVMGRPEVDPASLYPYLVFGFNATEQHGNIDDGFRASITFSVYDEHENGISRISSVLDRLFGNAIITSGRVPTYGFHRHRLTLSTNDYSAVGSDCFVRSLGIEATSDRLYVGTMEMTADYSALASSP